jgi:5-formyltetrahydrofolate cyclo-ligase
MASARTVCVYASFGTEPDTGKLIEALVDRGVTLLLPVLMPDRDLDWADYDPAGGLTAGLLGLREPTGARRGPDAVREADVVIAPALAISATGRRLGRGGGSYDRALARLGDLVRRPWVCALLYDHEVGVPIPVEPHDRSVDAACSASGIVRFDAPEGSTPTTRSS